MSSQVKASDPGLAEDAGTIEKAPPAESFAIFRWSDGRGLAESGAMTSKYRSEEQRANAALLGQAGSHEGASSRYLFAASGMSLAHIWFKSGFPLPLHAHDADCLYYIVGGSLRLGRQMLRSGDGFFVPANAPYTYSVGEGGVELLEFRTSAEFDITFPTTGRSYWEKLAATIARQAPLWRDEARPAPQFPEFT